MGIHAAEMARILGVSGQALAKRVKSGTVPQEDDGTFDPPKVIEAWYLNASPSHVARGRAGGEAARAARRPARGNGHAPPTPSAAAGNINQSYLAARAANESLAARLREIELRRLTGELIPANEVERGAFQCARRARDLLSAIPDRLASLVTGLTDRAAVHKLIADEVRRVEEELSRPPA